MLNPLFPGNVKGGKLHLERRDLFDKYLQGLEGLNVTCKVEKIKKDRSNKQNRYYNGVVLKILGKELGYDRDEMHDVCRGMFLVDNSRRFPTLKSTKQLTTVEMEEYLSDIRQWASRDLNIYIPLPNEVEW